MQPETLWLAPTRPAMKYGVPMEAWFLNMMGSFLFGLIMGSPLYWLVFIALHLPLRVLAAWDPNFFRMLRLWMATKGEGMGKGSYGASTLAPLPAVRAAGAREYATLV